MTWTLRLYDADGDEIGWATCDPLDYWVDESHPDAVFIDAMIDMEATEVSESAPTRWVAEDGAVYPTMDTVIEPNETPHEDRLEQAGVSCVREGWADRYELNDE
ncbi:hypothetical protein HTZ84_09530 [Haloterrigena sp. SYSU A558-1]|uniref:Uncharacterized protein n=1 Tax=Haloterrigena gelatinilytica TaxID=2741724 RepID=A0ABX2LFC6_9EURY|nr:hypothetical protein [Haloterrigena gelatinilytica]NUC72546.1 hypothetical protein [Haloterrigena gelatinilytica]